MAFETDGKGSTTLLAGDVGESWTVDAAVTGCKGNKIGATEVIGCDVRFVTDGKGGVSGTLTMRGDVTFVIGGKADNMGGGDVTLVTDGMGGSSSKLAEGRYVTVATDRKGNKTGALATGRVGVTFATEGMGASSNTSAGEGGVTFVTDGRGCKSK